MNVKKVSVLTLAIIGIYFLIFHTAPFPFSHEAIGLPPYHLLHAGIGVTLLVVAWYLGKKK